jgi:hypothetical protein
MVLNIIQYNNSFVLNKNSNLLDMSNDLPRVFNNTENTSIIMPLLHIA